MADRFKYSEVRQKIIDAIRTDLIGPRDKEEVLEENPRYAYLVGMLDIQSDDEDYSGAGEQEVDADMAFEDGEDFTAGEDDDNEPISTTHFQLPSSIGISFYIQSDTESINLDVTWGDYVRSSEKYTGKDEKEHSRAIYTRQPMETKHTLLSLNITDDYFKAKKQAEIFEQDLQQKDQEMYELKHELIALRMKIEETEKNAQEAQQQKEILEGKVKELNDEIDKLLK